VVSSDLSRASATADRISAGATRLRRHEPASRVRFRRLGRADLRRRVRRDPELSRAFWDTPGDIAAPDGESFFDVGARVAGAIAALADAIIPAPTSSRSPIWV
jgi:alpha-ribazole phosphatase